MPEGLNTSKETKRANKATSKVLTNLIQTSYELESATYNVKIVHARELKAAQMDRVFSILEENMYDLYKSSPTFGWKPAEKRKELTHSLSRYMTVQDSEKNIVAFVMFRFEHEYEENILYLYEVQVASSAQRKRIGKSLMADVETLAKHFDMEKIMLTVLKKNVGAKQLYTGLGFSLDASSPDEAEEDHPIDYEILSKVIQVDS